MAQGDILGFIKNRPGNLIINGAFEFNQRFGTTLNTTPLSYGLDRWFFNAGTSVARVSIANQNFDFAMEAIATAAQNNHTQRIESSMVKHLRGKTVTFSILARIISGAVSAQLRIKTNYANSKDDFSVTTQTNDAVLVQKQGNALDGTFRKFQYSFTITNEMADNGFDVNFGDFGSATNTLQFAQAMLNESGNAPEFERSGISYLGDLALCQRYYEKSYDIDVEPGTVTDNGSLAVRVPSSEFNYNRSFSVTKRVTPTLTFYNPNSGALNTWRNVSLAGDVAVSERAGYTGTNGFTPEGVASPANLINGHWVADSEL